MKRRQLLQFFGLGAVLTVGQRVLGQPLLGTPVASLKTGPALEIDEAEAALTDDDLRFRTAFTRALRRLRRRGAIPLQRYREIRSALFNSLTYKRDRQWGSFLQHLRHDVEQQAGDAWDDMIAAASMFLEALVQWIVESWNRIIDNVMKNLSEWKIAIEKG